MFYEEPAKKLPVSASVDVLVLGAGPAGVAAAISAGRQGAKTMLIEQLGDVGAIATGQATQGAASMKRFWIVPPICPTARITVSTVLRGSSSIRNG